MKQPDADRRLIEEYLPLKPISEESRRENSVTQDRKHLSKALLSVLHRWWARRPLSACRAAVYASLVPAPKDAKSLELAAKTLADLCRYKAPAKTLEAAKKRILEANAGHAPRVLDMFAGGGSMPLEAARLGCEAYAIELNPVAHLVELATLVYPTQFGEKLVKEVERWSKTVYGQVEEEIGTHYAAVADPDAKDNEDTSHTQGSLGGVFNVGKGKRREEKRGFLRPVAYLWTRTVPCPSPKCEATVPLVRQTWLRKKAGGFVALRPVPDRRRKRVRFELLTSEAKTAKEATTEWGFEPVDLSTGGETSCRHCSASVKTDYVHKCGQDGSMRVELMAVVCTQKGERGKRYFAASSIPRLAPDQAEIEKLQATLAEDLGISLMTAELPPRGALGFRVQAYGLTKWDQLFTSRQLLMLLTFVKHTRQAHDQMVKGGMDNNLARGVTTYLAFMVNKVAERSSVGCLWHQSRETIESPISEGKMPMRWNFPEGNPLGKGSGSFEQARKDVIASLSALVKNGASVKYVERGSALSLPFDDATFDAVVTDPPYYDNIPYAYLADFFYVWLKRSIGHLYPEHFTGETSPVRSEAVADPSRHKGNAEAADQAYEEMMQQAFSEGRRVLKSSGPMVVVYAHKTTAGWATLVNALRKAGFVVTEAWPLNTENPARHRARGSAALASSIFLVTRKRNRNETGDYEKQVLPELRKIVHERVATLLKLGVVGADLVIAVVGAGLRAYTQFGRVELASGEDLEPADYLKDVQRETLETIMQRVMKTDRGRVGGVDRATQYYVMGRFQYGEGQVDFDEANVLARGVGVELDGKDGLADGRSPLAKKSGDKVSLLNYAGRGEDKRLGLATDGGTAAPLIDVLHRLLWLADHRASKVTEFLVAARPDRQRLKLVAQALAGRVLSGGDSGKDGGGSRSAEQKAIDRLLAAWRRVVEEAQFMHVK